MVSEPGVWPRSSSLLVEPMSVSLRGKAGQRGRVLAMPAVQLYGRRAPAAGAQARAGGAAPPRGQPNPGLALPAASSRVAVALESMALRVTDRGRQRISQVGPLPMQGELTWRLHVGQLPERDGGAFASPARLQTEDKVVQMLAGWAAQEGAGAGWTLEVEWAGGKGTSAAALDVRVIGEAPSAVKQQLTAWLRDSQMRVPLPGPGGGQMVVPCSQRAGSLPLGMVQVRLRGIAAELRLKEVVATVLRAAGYNGQPGDAAQLEVREVFLGFHRSSPLLADGTVCAFVRPPPGDPQLSRLPATLQLGPGHSPIEVTVSSRFKVLIGARGDGPAPPPPPPPPPRAAPAPATRQAPPPRAWAAATQPALGRPPSAMAQEGGPEGMELEVQDTLAAAAGPDEAAAAAMAVDREPPEGASGTGVTPGAAEPAAMDSEGGDSFTELTAARPAVGALIAGWASDSFPDASPQMVQLVLEEVAADPAARAVIMGMVGSDAEHHAELLPPALDAALTAAFRRRGLAKAGYGGSSDGGSDQGGRRWQPVQRRTTRAFRPPQEFWKASAAGPSTAAPSSTGRGVRGARGSPAKGQQGGGRGGRGGGRG